MNKRPTPQSPADKLYLAYYEVQVMGATLYLHTIVKAQSMKEAGEKFFSQPTRKFGDVVLNCKGTVKGEVKPGDLPAEWVTMLQEVGAGINSGKLKAPKLKAPRIRTRPVRSIAAIQAIEAGKASGIDYPAGTEFPK